MAVVIRRLGAHVKTCARVAGLGLVVGLLLPTVVEPAGAPSPGHSTVPPCLRIDPAGTSTYQVVVRDSLNALISGANVLLDFTSSPGVRLCLASDPDRDRRVVSTSDTSGGATFHVSGGGSASAGTVQVFANGILLGSAIERSPDLDGDLLVDGADLHIFGSLPANSAAGDYDCDGDRDQADSLFVIGQLWRSCLYPLSFFGQIRSLNLPDYATYAVKLTFMGFDVGTITPSLAAVGPGRAFEVAAFGPYRRTFGYVNDGGVGDTLRLTNAELKAFVDGIAARPFLQDTTGTTTPRVSLMILRDSGPLERCWEFIAPSAALADSVFSLLRASIVDPNLRAIVDEYRGHMVGVCP